MWLTSNEKAGTSSRSNGPKEYDSIIRMMGLDPHDDR